MVLMIVSSNYNIKDKQTSIVQQKPLLVIYISEFLNLPVL